MDFLNQAWSLLLHIPFASSRVISITVMQLVIHVVQLWLHVTHL